MGLIQFPAYKLGDIPACLRRLADQLESGEEVALRAVVVLDRDDDEVDYKAFGAEPFTRATAVGLCFSACYKMLSEGRE